MVTPTVESLESRPSLSVIEHRRTTDCSVAAAKGAFRELDLETQLAVVQELIETRGEELRLAYPAVCGLGIGFRHRSDEQGKVRIHRNLAVCLRMIVRRKWPALSRKTSSLKGRIPEFVFASIGPPHAPTRVAIATDVEQRAAKSARRPQANIAVGRTSNSTRYETGSVACIIQESTPSGTKSYSAISCMHVLSNGISNYQSSEVPVDLLDDYSRLGLSIDRRGSLDDPNRPDFDAQWLRITNVTAAVELLNQGFSFASGGIARPRDLRADLFILTASGSVPVSFSSYWPAGQLITNAINVHSDLLTLSFSAGVWTSGGDSGSPLVADLDHGRVLVGMHIALELRNGQPVSLCIPAWDLLSQSLYRPAPRNVRWSIL